MNRHNRPFPINMKSNKCNINHVYLRLVLFTLTILILSILWLPWKLGGPHFQLSKVFPLVLRDVQNGGPETDFGGQHPTQPTPGNLLVSTTGQPETKPTEEYLGVHTIYKYIINEPDKCKAGDPFLILLITVERWQKEARQAIRQTWGKEDLLSGVKLLRLFLLGNHTKWTKDEKKSLLEESQAYHDIIQQDYLDTYKNLTTKVLMGLNWVATHCPGASYVMKTDSDMFINTEYLVNVLLKPDQPPRLNYFTGFLMRNARPIRDSNNKWYASPQDYPEDTYPVFCSGTGYVFSADLTSKIVKISLVVRWLHLEDVYIALCLQRLGLQPVAPPRGSDFSNWRVAYTDCRYNQLVTSHGVWPGEIIAFWNQLQQNKHNCTR